MNLDGSEFNRRLYLSWIEPQISDGYLEALVDDHLQMSLYLAGVAVNNHQIPLASTLLKDSGVKTIGTVAYPLGGLPLDLKVAQIEELFEGGADQVDVVMPMNSILDDDMSAVEQEIDALSEIKSRNPLCLIINTPWLNHDQLLNTVQRIHTTQKFILRTTTGYGMTTDLNVVESLKNEFGESLKIIVSGGCDTTQSGLDFIHAGAEGIYVNDLFSYIEGFLTLNAFQESQRESN